LVNTHTICYSIGKLKENGIGFFPYRGIRGYGKASILKDKGENILRLLVQTYFKGKETSRLHKLLLSEKHLQDEVAIEVAPVSMFEWDYKERMSDSV
jgi:hypothetical protein